MILTHYKKNSKCVIFQSASYNAGLKWPNLNLRPSQRSLKTKIFFQSALIWLILTHLRIKIVQGLVEVGKTLKYDRYTFSFKVHKVYGWLKWWLRWFCPRFKTLWKFFATLQFLFYQKLKIVGTSSKDKNNLRFFLPPPPFMKNVFQTSDWITV